MSCQQQAYFEVSGKCAKHMKLEVYEKKYRKFDFTGESCDLSSMGVSLKKGRQLGKPVFLASESCALSSVRVVLCRM